MAKINLPSDFAKEIAKSLGMTEKWVDEWFEIDENKEGYFIAKLKPKKFLEKDQFRTLCALTRDLGGEGYLQGAKAWSVPGPLAKKPLPQADTTSTPSPMNARSKPEPSGVTPPIVSMDKSKPTYTMVPIKALFSMPFQSRTTEDPEIEELVESIKVYGVLEPILVRPKPDGVYEIVAGERRVKAAEKAGLTEIPVMIRFLSDQEAYECQLIENIQRKDLADIEKARMLDYMIKKFGYLQKDLAKKLGKTEGWVSQHLAMLKIEELYPGKVEIGKLTERQARELLAASEEKREEILTQMTEAGEVPSAREIRRAVQPELAATTSPLTQEHIEHEHPPLPSESSIESSQKEHVEPPEPKPEPIDVAEFTCKICGETYRISHVKLGVHELELMKQ